MNAKFKLLSKILPKHLKGAIPEYIKGFNPETTTFCRRLIARFLLTSRFFCPTKMSDNLRMRRIFMTTPSDMPTC